MDYFLESSTAKNPTLEEMTRTAIQMLKKETNGYVLLVEGLLLIYHIGNLNEVFSPATL